MDELRDQIMEAMDSSKPQTVGHTDVLLPLRRPDEGQNRTEALGLASCIHIRTASRDFVLSCEHATKPDAVYFTAPRRLKRDIIPDDEDGKVTDIELLATNPELDLALFDGSGLDVAGAGKLTYDMNESKVISPKSIAANLKSLAFMCGSWGRMAKGHSYPDGLMYLNDPLYFALGHIHAQTPEWIIADFSEHEVFELRSDLYPQLADVTPNAGGRNLSGTSGSGLWVQQAGKVILAGILLGPYPLNEAERSPDEQLIRFTPVWDIIAWIESVVGGKDNG